MYAALAAGSVWLAPAALVGQEETSSETITAREASEAAARATLERWMGQRPATAGGAEARQAVERRGKIRLMRGMAPVPVRVRALANGAYRLDCELASGPFAQAFDGGIAWQHSDALGFGYLTETEHRANTALSQVDPRALVIGSYGALRRVLNQKVNGRPVEAIELRTPAGKRERWSFDPETGERVRVEQEIGEGKKLVVDFSDFRAVSGSVVPEPHRVVWTEGDRQAEVTFEQIAYDAAVSSADLAPPEGEPERQGEIERLLRAHRHASGEDRLAEFESRVTEQEVEVVTSGVKLAAALYQKRPDRFLSEQDSAGMGKMLRGYDGTTGWAWNEVEGFREIQGTELQQLKGSAEMSGPLRIADKCPLRRIVGRREVEGRTLYGVMLASVQGIGGIFYFDSENYDLREMESIIQAGPTGQLRVKTGFSDYRNVDGVLIPFRTTVTHPAMSMVVTVKSVKHNEPLDEAMFAPRRE